MKKYLATARNVIDTCLSQDFISDIEQCEQRGILIGTRKPTYHSPDDIQLFRIDGKNFPCSDKDYWTHNNQEYNVIHGEYQEVHFNDELFEL